MKKLLYILNDCMRKFSYERVAGLCRAAKRLEEPTNIYIVRSDGYSSFAPEHNLGEYNIYRLPDYRDYDGIFLDINNIQGGDSDSYTRGVLYAVRAAAESGRPVISVANDIEGFRYVGIDNHSAMQSVIRYLHRDLGLTDFWFAMGPLDNYENRTRTQALLDYCRENGLPCENERLHAGSFTIQSGMRAFDALRKRRGTALPQAVICANDHIALGVCHAAEAAGFSIPRDFMVTGFDNTYEAAYLSPAITSVDQLCWNTGDACVDAMRRIWAGEAVPRVIYTPTELVKRESTGRADSGEVDTRSRAAEYARQAAALSDFSYRLSALQYQLPGCKSIEEICEALTECLSGMGCKGLCLVLDGELFENRRMFEFNDYMGHMRDTVDGMPTEGYSGRMELVFHWSADGMSFERRAVGPTLAASDFPGPGENHLFVPLHFMEYTVGYLSIWEGLDLMQIKGVSAIANTLTMALRNYFSRLNLAYVNQVLSGISMKDDLSGLYNRLGYSHLACPMYREACERGQRLAIVFIDMDGMKHINDTYGHAMGDLAIQGVSNAIRHSIPGEAVPVRYGGDEFLVLAPAKDAEQVQAMLSAILAALPAEARALGVPEILAVSTGFLLTQPDHRKSLDEYVHEADALMYREKKAKKGQRQ